MRVPAPVRKTIRMRVRQFGDFGWVRIDVSGLNNNKVDFFVNEIKRRLEDDQGVGNNFQVEMGDE